MHAGQPERIVYGTVHVVQLHFVTLKDGQEIEVVVPSDLSEIIPDGTEIALNIVPEKVNVFNKETRSTLIREGV